MQHFLGLLVAAVFLSLVIGVFSDNIDGNVKALTNDNKRNPEGSYFYEYLLDNGASQKVTGTLKDVNGEKVYSVVGSYSYRQEDGTTLTVNYIADENGYRVLPVEKKALLHPVVPPTPLTVVLPTPIPYNRLTPPTIHTKAIASLLGG